MRTHVFSLYVAASTSRVWTALTSPEVTPQYFFGLRVESDWAAGSPVALHAPGMLVASGTVVHLERGRVLVHSLADGRPGDGPVGPVGPVSSLGSVETVDSVDPDLPDPQPATWVSWELEPREDGVTRVRLLVDELESDSEDEADETELVWSRLLSNLKTLLETGNGRVPRQGGAVLPETG